MSEEHKINIKINLGMNFIMLFWNVPPFDISSWKRIDPMMERIKDTLDKGF